MRSHQQGNVPAAERPTDLPDLTAFASYEDDGALVICDRADPKAWIRSETTARIEA